MHIGVSKASDMDLTKLDTYNYDLLAGVHRLTAFNQLEEEGFNDLPENIPVVLYFGIF